MLCIHPGPAECAKLSHKKRRAKITRRNKTNNRKPRKQRRVHIYTVILTCCAGSGPVESLRIAVVDVQ